MFTDGFNFDMFQKFATQVFGFMGKPESKEYADAVNSLHNPEGMRKILEARIEAIETDPKLSRSEKEALKNDVLAKYLGEDIKHIQNCADVVDRETSQKSENATKILLIVLALATSAGAAYGVASGIKNYSSYLHIIPRNRG